MTDLIKREDAIKAVLGITMYDNRVPIDTVIFQINSIPSAEPKWIPCSERLPEGDGQVLVNVVAHDRVYDIVLCFTEFVEGYYAEGAINAWMPLPKPWEGVDDETN